MAIFEKPFSFNELLRRTVFKGRPNFFNAKDFNKELLILHNFIEEFNSVFGVWSDVDFEIPNISESFDDNTEITTRTINLTWGEGSVLYKGIKVPISEGGVVGYTQEYSKPPSPDINAKDVGSRPPTYIILKGTLRTVTYAQNPVLCGIQSDELPSTAPTVDVEQYQDVEIKMTSDPSEEEDVLCILATIHQQRSGGGFGFLYNVFRNKDFTYDLNNTGKKQIFQSNDSLYEYIMERVIAKLSNVINETQLARRFNLSELSSFNSARHNVGFSNLVNHRQLVRDENLNDIPKKPLARANLGLGNAATQNFGYGATNVAPGNIIPINGIIMWSGGASSIPSGYVLCDGSNDTPNLSGRFIVGLDPSNPKFNTVGKTGGQESVKLTASQSGVGNHSHAGFTKEDGAHKHELDRKVANRENAGNIFSNNSNIPGNVATTFTKEDGAHSHGLDIGNTSAAAQDAHENLPPYYTLCFIMFKGEATSPRDGLKVSTESNEDLDYPNFSEPSTSTKGGFTGEEEFIGGSNGEMIGPNVTLTNPE